ncbi:uncharacterized protein I303_102182 [Kwoniella dejecticola CBS 10117]|uniref:N-acetyltransferase domain-containing protein n=1 Tax=Kwoniella dejecticola CBS 10117 TaxID=1296121 RepID=A0A1A6ABQ6_9TREE|nr:uncharacterized protein I303_01678 [Kwoniella dejecticola CBS 10117]OBR87473.1 hypothetical protein I303_01678 [Kwoniella dejecticola CBS 10117]
MDSQENYNYTYGKPQSTLGVTGTGGRQPVTQDLWPRNSWQFAQTKHDESVHLCQEVNPGENAASRVIQLYHENLHNATPDAFHEVMAKYGHETTWTLSSLSWSYESDGRAYFRRHVEAGLVQDDGVQPDIWTVRDLGDVIRGVITYTNSGKSYNSFHTDFSAHRKQQYLESLATDKEFQEWADGKCAKTFRSVRRNLGFSTKNSLKITSIVADQSCPQRGYATALVEQAKKDAQAASIPAWCYALDERAVAFWQKSDESVPVTGMTYIPPGVHVIRCPSHTYLLRESSDAELADKLNFLSHIGPQFDPQDETWKLMSDPKNEGGKRCELFTSSDAAGIQAVIAFTLPQNSQEYSKWTEWDNKYYEASTALLEPGRQFWRRTTLKDTWDEIMDSLARCGYKNTIELAFLVTPAAARGQGHASALVDIAKAAATEAKTPIWLAAHHDEPIKFYSNRGFKTLFRKYLPLNAKEDVAGENQVDAEPSRWKNETVLTIMGYDPTTSEGAA